MRSLSVEIDFYQRAAEYRIDEYNSKLCQFLEPNFSFPNSKISGRLLIFQFDKFEKLSKVYNFENR